MAQTNVDAVRAIYDGWSRGEFQTGLDLYDPHIVLVTGPRRPRSKPSA